MKTSVLIIGAGPTGLMAANQLARFGINFIIVDYKKGPTVESRAVAVTTRSLEIYQQMGLSDTVIEQGIYMTSLGIYSNGKPKVIVKIGEIGTGFTEFNYLVGFEQSKNEELLYKNLKAAGHEVHWGHELLKVSQDTNEVTAEVSLPDRTKKIITSKYLIACDGAKSLVRHQLNFKFEGGTYENKFFVADTIMKWDLPYDRLSLAPTRHNFCGFWPIKGENTMRVLGTLPKEFAEREDITFQEVEALIKKTIGVELTFEKVNWFSVYKLHHRCVDNFRSGNIFLAGDAAHIHSPAGGQGMNTGLQDAYNLSWKMAFILKGFIPENILYTYNEERLPFAKWLMNFTDRMFNIMTSDHWFTAAFRKYIVLNMISKVFSLKKVRPIVFTRVSQLWYSYNGKTLSANFSLQKTEFKAGDRFPYIEDPKTKESFYKQLTEPCFHLVGVGTPHISEEFKKHFPFPVKIIQTPLSVAWVKKGVNKDLFILVRPDNYIAFMSDQLLEETIKNYLKNAGFRA